MAQNIEERNNNSRVNSIQHIEGNNNSRVNSNEKRSNGPQSKVERNRLEMVLKVRP
jgi:hypothetical protein